MKTRKNMLEIFLNGDKLYRQLKNAKKEQRKKLN